MAHGNVINNPVILTCRYRKRKRIVSDGTHPAAGGRNQHITVAHGHTHHALIHTHIGIVTGSAKMVASPNIHNTDAGIFCLFNRQCHGLSGNHHTQIVISVHNSQRGAIPQNGNFSVGLNAFAADTIQVIGYPEKAVGKDTPHFCLHQHVGHNLRICGRNTCCFKEPAVSGCQFVNIYFHFHPPKFV